MEAEGYKLTFYILMLFKYFFIITPILVIITTILSMIEFKNKKLRDIFNHKDTINGFTTLITVLILGTIGLLILIYRSASYLNSVGRNIKFDPLITKVIIPVFSLKFPNTKILSDVLNQNIIFIVPILIFMVICLLIKRKDTASKSMAILATMNLLLMLFTYKLYTVYHTLFIIKMH